MVFKSTVVVAAFAVSCVTSVPLTLKERQAVGVPDYVLKYGKWTLIYRSNLYMMRY
jgi:hypothetical protein